MSGNTSGPSTGYFRHSAGSLLLRGASRLGFSLVGVLNEAKNLNEPRIQVSLASEACVVRYTPSKSARFWSAVAGKWGDTALSGTYSSLGFRNSGSSDLENGLTDRERQLKHTRTCPSTVGFK